ncbi:MAG: quinolinate synthase NadA [Anaerolineae bacterium]|nr:quinolinate synthase NadA [Anaerolineae bacterium]
MASAEHEVVRRIQEAKERLGKDLLILGHHYQSDEVIRFADYRGDSLELSRVAASSKEASWILFCGVDFMAESAALLCDARQKVFIPSSEAICPMAVMAERADAAEAWVRLIEIWGEDIVPVTYQNSSAELKAFCGERGGAVCTSSNAGAVFRWAFGQKGHVLFFPDEHLGRNTALSLGLSAEEIAVWDPEGVSDQHAEMKDSKVVVWKGYCRVHTRFTVEQVQEARRKYPEATVVVHPECLAEVVSASDESGSTSRIVRVVEESPAGAVLVIGTEMNLVSRLAAEHPDKAVVPLSPSLCGAMSRITPQRLLATLEAILSKRVGGAMQVPAETVAGATLALDRMLAVA